MCTSSETFIEREIFRTVCEVVLSFSLCSPTMTIELKHTDLTIIITLSCSRYIRLYHASACHVCVTKRRKKNYPSTHYYRVLLLLLLLYEADPSDN